MSWKERLIQLFLSSKHRIIGVTERGPLEARHMIERGVPVLDVREAVEHEWGRVPGNLHIPLADMQNRINELAPLRETEFLVICHGGLRSGDACRRLRRLGFHTPVNLAGGILAWHAANLPTEGHGKFDPEIVKAARRV